MDNVTEVTLEPLQNSQFVKPLRLRYKQNGKSKIWDLVSLHESVCIIIFNVDRKKLILVKQFRPAVYYNGLPKKNFLLGNEACIDDHPASEGITLELCAGLVDKTSDITETAQTEVLEECGYNAPISAFEKVISFRAGVGVSGEMQTLFFVEVSDSMKISDGGGLASEGEFIEVEEMSIPEAKEYMQRPQVNSPGGFLFGLMWFLHNKAHLY